MHGLDLINTSVLGALGCNMSVFLRYFPAAETMYEVFVALAIGPDPADLDLEPGQELRAWPWH